MTNPTVQVAIMPGVWLRQHTGTMVVQINAYTFKETRNTGEGWAFVDFHRGVPTDCVPLMAEVIPENVEEIATHPTETPEPLSPDNYDPDSAVRCGEEGPNGQCDQDARLDHWCIRRGNPIETDRPRYTEAIHPTD